MTLAPDRVEPVVPPGPPEGLSPRNQEKAHALGLTSATGLVIGSIVGTGVFTMPAVIAGAGTMGIIVLGVIAVGAMLLAVLFGQLTKRVPNSDGGLYAYCPPRVRRLRRLPGRLVLLDPVLGRQRRHRVVLGLLRRRPVRLGPSLAAWRTGASPWSACGCRPSSTWPASARWPGSRTSPSCSSSCPLLFVGVVGWFFVTAAHFGPFNASGGSLYSAIGIAAGVALFSFIGVEAAAMTAKRVQEPRGSTSAGPRSSAPRSAPCSTCWSRRWSWAWWRTTPWSTPGRPSSTPSRRSSPTAAWAGKFIAAIAVDLGHRGAERLDADRHRDVTGHGPGRPVPPALRLDRQARARPGSASWSGPRCRRCSCCGATTPVPGSPSSPTWST